MYHFSQEELTELANYPRKALEHAVKLFGRAISQGKTIRNPFMWHVAVCDAWVKDNQVKTPQKGSMTAQRPSEGPLSVWKKTDYGTTEPAEETLRLYREKMELPKNAHLIGSEFYNYAIAAIRNRIKNEQLLAEPI